MILENIKQQTKERHNSIEQTGLLHAMTNDALSREHYARVLKVFYGFFQPLEDKINKFSELGDFLTDIDTRRKTVMLKKDLICLHAIHPDDAPEICDNLPPIQTVAQAFGCLYVMEGSTLGGKFIARNVSKTLGLDAACGVSFFNGYGQDTGLRWKTFQQALIAFSNSSGQEQEIIQAANDTFDKFERWINKN